MCGIDSENKADAKIRYVGLHLRSKGRGALKELVKHMVRSLQAVHMVDAGLLGRSI